MPDDTGIIQNDGAKVPESHLRAFGSTMSVRAIITVLIVITLCAVTFKCGATYEETFKTIASMVVSFYMGQKTSKT